jgi:hypothetical protein
VPTKQQGRSCWCFKTEPPQPQIGMHVHRLSSTGTTFKKITRTPCDRGEAAIKSLNSSTLIVGSSYLGRQNQRKTKGVGRDGWDARMSSRPAVPQPLVYTSLKRPIM